jgi:Ser/Thr protein kinase RdoA (MazF antagonist)
MSVDTTDLFLSLTPDKVLEAVQHAGLQPRPVCYTLNSFENRVYDIELEDESRVVAKFYRPKRWSRDQILEEHLFLADLEAAEVPVCGVRPFPDGETLKTNEDGIHYCVFHRKGGRAPDELSDVMVTRLGMLTARMHNVGSARRADSRVRINPGTYIYDNIDWMVNHRVLPDQYRQRYMDAAFAIADIAADYFRDVEIQRIHGDLHKGNLVERGGVLHVLDFDDMVIGPAVQDFWLLLPDRDAAARRQREIFIEAYEQFRSFDRSSLRLIEPLRAMRYVHYAAWLARRWHDPAFPSTWPHFGTDEYWAGETQDLEKQLRVIRDGDPQLSDEAPDKEEELTNADFFWDWED